jgi:hypothetical protein
VRTPEGKIKDEVRKFLKERRVASLSAPVVDAVGYYHMYVPSGYGDPALDFTGCYKGWFFAIETKAGTNIPSAMQKLVMKMQENARGYSIWGNDAEVICKQLTEFFDWADRRHDLLA